ncbi:MAG: hypothetical protein WBA51_05570 [Erythrobacter sp.]
MDRIVSQSAAAFAAIFLTLITISSIVTVPAASALAPLPILA